MTSVAHCVEVQHLCSISFWSCSLRSVYIVCTAFQQLADSNLMFYQIFMLQSAGDSMSFRRFWKLGEVPSLVLLFLDVFVEAQIVFHRVSLFLTFFNMFYSQAEARRARFPRGTYHPTLAQLVLLGLCPTEWQPVHCKPHQTPWPSSGLSY